MTYVLVAELRPGTLSKRDMGSNPSTKETSFDAFQKAVRESVEFHAKRKGYIKTDDVDSDQNALLQFKKSIGVATGHHIGELATKLAEYMTERRRVILVKCAGWLYLEWKDCEKE